MKKFPLIQMKASALLLGLFLVFSCSDDPEPTPPPVVEPPVTPPSTLPPVSSSGNWEKLTVFTEDMYNATYSDGKFTALGRNFLYYNASLESENERQFLGNYLTRLGRYKLPLSDNTFVSRTEADVFIFPMGKLEEDNAVILNMTKIDPDFKAFDDVQYFTGNVLGLNKSGTVALIPYRTSKGSISIDDPSFLLMKIQLDEGKASVTDTLIVTEKFLDYFAETTKVNSYENFFLVEIDAFLTYLVDHEGIFEKVSNYRIEAVEFGEKVYFIEENRDSKKLVVYSSGLDGKERILVGETALFEDLRNAAYTVIGDQIVGYTGDKIFKVKIENNQVSLEMLANGSISGSISSMVQVGENEVVITVIRLGQGGAYRLSVNTLLGK
jgi:hypothetical protein